MKRLPITAPSRADLAFAFLNKKATTALFMAMFFVAIFSSCSKNTLEEIILPLDPFATPTLIEDNSLEAQSKVALLINERKDIQYLIDFPNININDIICNRNSTWILNLKGSPILKERIIILNGKYVKEITYCPKIIANIRIINTVYIPMAQSKIRFFNIIANLDKKSPNCSDLNNYIDSVLNVENIGGVRVIN